MTKTKERKLTIREELFVDLLPAHNWVIYQAGMAAGFKEKYAKWGLPTRILHNPTLNRAVEAKKTEFKEKTEIDAKELTKRFNRIALKSEELCRMTDANAANSNIGKHIGYFEADNIQKAPKQQTAVILGSDEAHKALAADYERKRKEIDNIDKTPPAIPTD
jgi:hypothetical protein